MVCGIHLTDEQSKLYHDFCRSQHWKFATIVSALFDCMIYLYKSGKPYMPTSSGFVFPQSNFEVPE